MGEFAVMGCGMGGSCCVCSSVKVSVLEDVGASGVDALWIV